MSELQVASLSEVSETLLIPLYFRALEAQEKNPIVFDSQAVAIIKQLHYDFSKLNDLSTDRVFSMMRCRQFDHWTEDFITRHPAGRIVEIGCGLSDRQSRIHAFNTTWYNLDLPEVMAIRAKLLGEHEHSQSISGSVLDPFWLDLIKISPGEKCLFLAEGVLVYFPEDDVKRLFLLLQDHFPGCEIVFDALSPLMIAFHRRGSSMKKAAAQLRWALRDERDLEHWHDGIQCLASWRYFDQPEPRLGLAALMRFIPPLANGSMVLRYQLG